MTVGIGADMLSHFVHYLNFGFAQRGLRIRRQMFENIVIGNVIAVGIGYAHDIAQRFGRIIGQRRIRRAEQMGIFKLGKVDIGGFRRPARMMLLQVVQSLIIGSVSMESGFHRLRAVRRIARAVADAVAVVPDFSLVNVFLFIGLDIVFFAGDNLAVFLGPMTERAVFAGQRIADMRTDRVSGPGGQRRGQNGGGGHCRGFAFLDTGFFCLFI